MPLKTTAKRVAAALRAPWPISTTLAILFFGASAAILLAVSGYLYHVLEDKLAVRDRGNLDDYALSIQQILLEGTPNDADWVRKAEERALGSMRFDMRVLTQDGQTLFESPAMDAMQRDFPLPAEAPGSNMATVKWKSAAGEAYMLASAWVTQGDADAPQYRLQLALDLTESEAILDSYKHELLLVLCIALLAVALAAAAVVHAALRPLRDFTRAARDVRADSLSVRIGARRWPTELLGLSNAFDQMLARLEDSFTRLSRYSSDLAHEFRSPMQNLIASTTVALSRTRSIEDYQLLLDASLHEYERVSRMVEHMLFIARSENAETRLQGVWVSSKEQFDVLFDYFGIAAEEAGVTFQIRGTARIWTDPELLRQAVSNLLSNALAHTPVHGVISLSARNDPDGAAYIDVENSGQGIAAEHLPKLFDRFYRADSARPCQGAGTGLGLAIVQTILRLHGGEVSVSSAAGQGATFTLRFPGNSSAK